MKKYIFKTNKGRIEIISDEFRNSFDILQCNHGIDIKVIGHISRKI